MVATLTNVHSVNGAEYQTTLTFSNNGPATATTGNVIYFVASPDPPAATNFTIRIRRRRRPPPQPTTSINCNRFDPPPARPRARPAAWTTQLRRYQGRRA